MQGKQRFADYVTTQQAIDSEQRPTAAPHPHAGLILADSANMIMRIAYSWLFIQSRVPGLSITSWAPSLLSCCAAASAAVALREALRLIASVSCA